MLKELVRGQSLTEWAYELLRVEGLASQQCYIRLQTEVDGGHLAEMKSAAVRRKVYAM